MSASKKFAPESLMMSYGYKPELSEGAIKSPLFQTSTFVFKSAEDGKNFFQVAYGLRAQKEGEEQGLIYSRINNPDLEILENRLSLWDEAGDSAVFESGMAAISSVLLEFLSPGDLLLHSTPLYGGTDHFIHGYLKKIGVHTLVFKPWNTEAEIIELIKQSGYGDKLGMIYVETPANPTNAIIDLDMCKRVANHFSSTDKKVLFTVDNTYMGPLWQHPLKHGADFSLYSATKYIGGHSDVIAGAVCGSVADIKRLKGFRTIFGNMPAPMTAWLLLRSLETLKIRMERQAANAQDIVAFLNQHPKVEKVYYLGNIKEDSKHYEVYKRHYSSPGAMLSFDVKGGEAEAFRFLNALQIFQLAVSLGSTESLASHPDTMTHAPVDPAHKIEMSITGKLVRLSIGVENSKDLIWDLEQALAKV